MVRQWIEPVTDRTYGHVQAVQFNPELKYAKGAWNAEDLNRVEQNTAYCVEYMLENKIYNSDPQLIIREHNYWTGDMVPTYSEISRIINNVVQITEYARSRNVAIARDLPIIFASTHVDYVLANNIEIALNILHTQPKLPANYFKLEIEQGLILRIKRIDGEWEDINSNVALIAEDEVATIRAVPEEPDAQYKIFQYWSGDENDLPYLDDWLAEETNYLGQYRDVKFTANFQTRIPRKLTLTNAYISVDQSDKAETGPSVGTYYAGDRVMIIANRASSGKAFHKWTGTEAALENIVGVSEQDPSTAWLSMPDCDVNLAPKYINAGQHIVTVINGSGSGVYDYDEYVTISANVPAHYGFDNWSGDTAYLEDRYGVTQSFRMPDVNISFTANFSYRYSYNDIQIINGLIAYDGEQVTSVSGIRESSSLSLVPTPPNNTQGLDYWSVEGAGHVSGNTFYVGDGNAIITGHYNTIRTLIVNNMNNANQKNVYTAVQGHSWGTISTSYSVGDYYFRYWEENGEVLSRDRSISLSAEANDREITAIYEYVPPTPPTPTPEFEVEYIFNGVSQGKTTVLQGTRWSRNAQDDIGEQLREGWYKDGIYQSNDAEFAFYVYADTVIEVKYRDKERYTLTVVNGHITDTGLTVGIFKERQTIGITADDPAPGATMTGWYTTGHLYSYPGSSKTTTVSLGRGDATVVAQYKNVRAITVVTHSGTNVYNVLQGNSIEINAAPYPTNYEWDTSVGWTIDAGGSGTFSNNTRSNTYFTAGETDATIRANYKAIPRFKVTVENGYVQNELGQWVEEAMILRNSAPAIMMKPAPEGYKFLQWETLVGDNNDVYQPFAETTSIRNLTHDVRVRATYYIPNPEVKYTLQIIRTDGTIDVYHNSVGYKQSISASSPAEGMKFYRWEGDFQYLTVGRYEAVNSVNTPDKDITLEETFKPKDWIVKYHLYMTGYSECMSDQSTEHWVNDWEYEEGTKVRIRTKSIPFGWVFRGWQVVDVNGDEHPELLTNVSAEETTIEMPTYDVYITAAIAELDKYTMTIIDGETNASYYEGGKADIYYTKKNTEDIHYEFIRWTGTNIQNLKDYYTGKQFNVLIPGTADEPQFVKMPAYNMNIKATYTTLFLLDITNGTISDLDPVRGPYYPEGTKVNIVANTPESGQYFVRWDGDIDCVSNPFNPITDVTTRTGSIRLRAIYATAQDRNNIGYVERELEAYDMLNKTEIVITSGEIGKGFIITDTKGHNYVIINVLGNTVEVSRVTQIS